MKTESTIGKLKSEVTEIQDYHRQSSIRTISESLQEREVDTTRVWQSKKDHVYTVSNDQANLLEHYRYTAFGEPEIYSPQTENKLEGSAIVNPVFRDSRRYDEQTDLYYRYRHYKAATRRWLGRDPIGEEGGVNLYGFVGNRPLFYWDMFGLKEIEVEKCTAYLYIGHSPKKEIKWKFNGTCSIGGYIGCFPSTYFPKDPWREKLNRPDIFPVRWPNTPTHDVQMMTNDDK